MCHLSYLPGALLLSLALATPAMGQRVERLPAPSPAECDAAAGAGPLRARDYGEALFTLSICPVRGAEALLAEWETPPSDRVALDALGEASRTMRDQRLFNGIATRALADGTPPDQRHALVNVLIGYVDRSTRVWFEGGCWEYAVSTASPLVTDGSQPLDRAQTDRRVLEIVRALESRGLLGTKALCAQKLSQWVDSRVNPVRPDPSRPPRQ